MKPTMSVKNTESDDEASFQYRGVPEEDAWLLSRLLFSWEKPLFQRANKLHKRGEALQQEDLLPLPSSDHGEEVGDEFENAWKKEGVLPAPSVKKLEDLKDSDDQGTAKLRQALLAVMGPRFIVAGFIKAANTSLQFCFPLLLNAILKFIEETQAGLFDDSDPWHVRYRGYWLSAVLMLAMASKAVTENAYFHRVYRCGYRAKVAVSVSVYNKSLRLTNAERQSTTLGELAFEKPPFAPLLTS
jgi:hypothetical protein